MAAPPPSLSQEAEWCIDHAHVTAWRQWDGEVVVYDDLSGDTLKLDAIMSVIFNLLLKTTATTTQLSAQLARTLDLENDPKLSQVTELALRRLADSRLVQQKSVSPRNLG